MTALAQAVISSDLEVAEFLLSKGADPNIPNNLGETPLHQAVDSSELDLARLLLDNGADPNKSTTEGETPLHFACYRGDIDMVLVLLFFNADPNFPNEFMGRTPLHYAMQLGVQDCIEALLKHNGDLHIPDFGNVTPFSLASANIQESVAVKRVLTTIEEEGEDEPETENLEREECLVFFLESIGLEEYFKTMVKSGFEDLYCLVEQMHSPLPLTQEMLASCGIEKPGHQKRIILQLQGYSMNGDFNSTPLEDWLQDLGLEYLSQLFIESGYDDLRFLRSLMYTHFPVNEKVLEEEVGVFLPADRTKIIDSLRRVNAQKSYGQCQRCLLF